MPFITIARTTATEMNVTDIPRPWAHKHGIVVDVEYPADRPDVVDLVLADGLKTAETKTSVYARRKNGQWDIARFVPKSARWNTHA